MISLVAKLIKKRWTERKRIALPEVFTDDAGVRQLFMDTDIQLGGTDRRLICKQEEPYRKIAR